MPTTERISILAEDGSLSPDELETEILDRLKGCKISVIATGTKSQLTGDTVSYAHFALNLAGALAVHIVASAIYDLAKSKLSKLIVNGRDVSGKSKSDIEHILSDDNT